LAVVVASRLAELQAVPQRPGPASLVVLQPRQKKPSQRKPHQLKKRSQRKPLQQKPLQLKKRSQQKLLRLKKPSPTSF
jgi:hypothetical protein